MNYLIITYSIYLLLSICLALWVGRILFRHGRIFLIGIFHGSHDLADAVNKLLLAGFYLVNIGYAVFNLKTSQEITDATGLIELLSIKVGTIILILGGMHFFNLFILFNLRNKAKKDRLHIPNAE